MLLFLHTAGMVKLADTRASGARLLIEVGVQIPLPANYYDNTKLSYDLNTA